MSKTQFGILLAVAAITGLIGGAASPWLATPKSALAQDNGQAGASDKKSKKGKVLRAKKIQLISDDDKVLAELGSENDREMGTKVSWTLFDGSGKERVRLFAADRATGLELADMNGKDRIVLSESSVGSGGSSRIQMNLNDANGKPRVRFDMSTFGAMTSMISNVSGSGIELVASVFKDAPLFRVVGRGGSEVWRAQ